MRRFAILAGWLLLTFGLAWFPPLNAAVKGEPPSHPVYTGPYTPVRVAFPVVTLPTASMGHTTKPTPQGASVSGIASWYRYTAGEAAAGPALRQALGQGWRGRIVTVCASRCVRVVLSDWCQCYGARVIDLDARSFALLAPLSRGVVKVTVRWRTTP